MGGIRITTSAAGIELRALDADDAEALHRVIADNRAHLTAGGDYEELVALDVQGVADMLAREDVAGYLFGVLEQEQLVGVVSLVPVDPPRYGCGYWLAQAATGRGIARASLRALLVHARDSLQATDVFAGISQGNTSSEKVIQAAGFTAVESFPTYTRFHIHLTDDLLRREASTS